MARVRTRRARTVMRHRRVRKDLSGTAERPRLAVFRSLSHIYAQVIDDQKGNTLAAASSLEAQVKAQAGGLPKAGVSRLVGALIARRAVEQGVTRVVFDRGGFKYHGRVRALADSARDGGLVF